MAEHYSEKTEQATPKRRQEARSKGQVARSREIPSVAVLMAGTGMLYLLFPAIYSNFMDMTFNMLSSGGVTELTEYNIYPFWITVLKGMFFSMLPFLFVIALAGPASNIMQFGFVFSTESLEPKLSRINPVEGIKKIVSLRSAAELIKSIIKIAIIGYIAYLLIRREYYTLPMLVDTDVRYILSYTGRLILRLLLWSGSVLALLSAIDYVFQKWEYQRSLKMTRQEIKEEFRQSEGDPLIKSRIRSLQREAARKRMMSDVPAADVVITNPVHLAVAISYKHGRMGAPKVVAKGAGVVAEKIKEIARTNSVVIVENKPIARTLYRVVEIGGEIPSSLYKAVAEVLAYVYRLKRKI